MVSKKVSAVMTISHTKPDNLGIDFEHYNKLPRPNKEIPWDEAMRLLFTHSHGLQGVDYAQVFLSWKDIGESPNHTGSHIWSVKYRWMLSYGIAVCTHYGLHHRQYDHQPELDTGMGMFVKAEHAKPDDKNPYGYWIRFFRIGC